MFFWILLASKRAYCKPCYSSPTRHSRRTAASSSSLIETCRITNSFFDYKGDESSLMMHSKISTIFFYSNTGLLNKSIYPLILLLKTHDFIKSITLVGSQDDRQSGRYHFVRPHVA